MLPVPALCRVLCGKRQTFCVAGKPVAGPRAGVGEPALIRGAEARTLGEENPCFDIRATHDLSS